MSYLLIGLEGTSLTAQEKEWLASPQVGGLTLFSRNVESVEQVQALVSEIRQLDPAALLCIDQEGGRVQRIGAPCTALPALGRVGDAYRSDEDHGLSLAFDHAWLMAAEMRALGLDLSFAPVLDLARGSQVIGDRSFGADPNQIKELARAYIKGMHEAGMPATGKHFPGHGSVLPDTHVDFASDQRPFDEIAISDLRPFTVAAKHGLDAVMMAHVCYPKICSHAAGYSSEWIQTILRQRIGFEGAVFSDDLGMRAAESAGSYQARVARSMQAGCDFVLVCRPDDVAACFKEVTDWPPIADVDPRDRLRRSPPPAPNWTEFIDSPHRLEAQARLDCLA